MRNKGLKVLSTSALLSALVLTGCSCSNSTINVTEIKNGKDDVLAGLSKDAGKLTLSDLYELLLTNDSGNKQSADVLVKIIGNEVLGLDKENSEYKKDYAKLAKEKLEEFQKSEDYKVNGKFNEEYFVITLRTQGYKITQNENKEYDYTSFIEAKFGVEIISTLLKQKYIKEEVLKEKQTSIDKKKIRDVQYISMGSSIDEEYDPYKEEDKEVKISASTFMQKVVDKIVADSTSNVADLNKDNYFDTFEDNFKLELKKSIDTEFKKINTSDDYNGSIANEYTGGFTHSELEGKKMKEEAVDKLEYSFDKLISSDSKEDAVVSANITTRLLALAKPEENKRTVVKIGDWYYLASSFSNSEVTGEDILLTESDGTNYTYSIVRFKVINKENYNETEEREKEVIEYLAETSTLGNPAVSHYLEKNKDKIKIVDDSTYKYLKALYPDVFNK